MPEKDNECISFGCKGSKDRIGILFAQLGTPDSPTAKDLRPYLRQFLWDKRVIEDRRWLWWFILNLIVVPLRSPKSAALYKRIWFDEGSPLRVITEQQVENVERLIRDDARFGVSQRSILIRYGMRYGKPSLESIVKEMAEEGCRRILLVPMYPQYSATTTAAVYDAVFDGLKSLRWVPTLKVMEPYYNNELYLRAQADIINQFIAKAEIKPEKLVFSYHGIPIKYMQRGDSYCCMCTETTARLKPLLNMSDEDIIHTFQSRFGRDPWLQPYTDYTIKDLGKEGVKNIVVACPGFTADCLETLDEIGNEALEEFTEHGGEHLELIPCLNSHEAWMKALTSIIFEEIEIWIKRDNVRKTTCVECPTAPFIANL